MQCASGAKMESTLSKQTHNHMRAPKSASFVANMRKAFGSDNVLVTYVKENDVSLGEPADGVWAAGPLAEVPEQRRKAA